MEIITNSTQETEEFAKQIAKDIKAGAVLALTGDLGSGKTTFTRYLVNALGFDSRVQSPTFVLHRTYKNSEGIIKTTHHLDLYRLEETYEVEALGLKELFEESDSISIIEWPEVAKEYLPQRTIYINFTYENEDTRRISIQNIH